MPINLGVPCFLFQVLPHASLLEAILLHTIPADDA